MKKGGDLGSKMGRKQEPHFRSAGEVQITRDEVRGSKRA